MVEDLEKRLSARMAGRAVVMTSSGRAAIWRVLTGLGIGAGDEVIIQAFTCLAVPAAVQWAGATAVYTDIDAATFNLDVADVVAKITPRTRAVIVQHTFGIPGPVRELARVAAEHKIALIEDCAHALGATVSGQPVGTFGDAAILSFGRDKALSCVFGGAIVCRDQALARRIKDEQATLHLPPAWWVMQQLFHPILFSWCIPFYYTLGLGKAAIVMAQRLRLVSKVLVPVEKSGGRPAHVAWRFSPALGSLLSQQLDALDSGLARRRKVAARYARALRASWSGLRLEEASWLRYPVRVAQPAAVRLQARRYHMVLGDWYNTPVAPADVRADSVGYVPGSCPRAEVASREIVNLPTYPKLTDAECERVVTFLAKIQIKRS